jgi:hypothetical protein
MVQLTSNLNQDERFPNSRNTDEIKKGLKLVGLNFSDSELYELETQQIISIEDKSLDEVGSVLILAAAISSVNLGCPKKKFTFRDLPQVVHSSACSSGIPIYCWDDEKLIKKCLYLTLMQGKPVIILSRIGR